MQMASHFTGTCKITARYQSALSSCKIVPWEKSHKKDKAHLQWRDEEVSLAVPGLKTVAAVQPNQQSPWKTHKPSFSDIHLTSHNTTVCYNLRGWTIIWKNNSVPMLNPTPLPNVMCTSSTKNVLLHSSTNSSQLNTTVRFKKSYEHDDLVFYIHVTQEIYSLY